MPRRKQNPRGSASLIEEALPGDARKRFTVYVPIRRKTLYRAVTGMDETSLLESFESNSEAGRKRMRDEDTADYSAISAFAGRPNAVAQAEVLNRIRARKGRPLLSHIAAFTVEPERLDAYAPDGEEGHHLVWGDARSFVQRVRDLRPI